MAFDIDDGHIRVEGLRKTMRALSNAGVDAQDMKSLMHEIGMLVVRAANPPIGKTNKLANSVRAGRGKTKAVVRAGGAKAPYAGVIHYGWPGHNIKAQPFLTQALAAQRSNVFDTLDKGVGTLLKKNELT